MDARRIERIEQGADIAAAVVFAAAAVYAALRFGPLAAAAAGAAAFYALLKALQAIKPSAPTYAVETFEPAALPPAIEPEPELLLTHVYQTQQSNSEAALELDDVLSAIGNDSRVVRLFDPAAMPSPSELKTRIDRHLDDAPAHSADASQALHEALAELRKSLR